MVEKTAQLRHFFLDGSYIDFSREHIGDFRLEEVLLALYKEKRFANATNWSVLEHSLAVGRAAQQLYDGNNLLIQHAYFHDIQESIIRDLPTPFKDHIGKAWYDLENMIQAKMFEHLRIGAKLGDGDSNRVHELDKAMCFVEILNIFGPDCEMLDTQPRYSQEALVACGQAFTWVSEGVNVVDDYGDVNPHVVGLFKEIISLSTL